MRDLIGFRTAVRTACRGAGRTQQQLARAIGLHPHVLSHKLNGKDAALTSRDAVAIAGTLAEWGAFTSRSQVIELLGLLELPPHAVPAEAWNSEPLARLHAEQSPADLSPRAERARRVLPRPLPAPITSFIGRERLVQSVLSALSEARLVTLTGVGGTGKTRLAIEAATRLARGYADGAAFADLATVEDTELAMITVAHSLGLSPSSVAAAEAQLAEAVRDLELLVLVDNVEQLGGVGTMLSRLVQRAPRLRLLVTSRAALRVHGEHIVRVPPLTLPAPSADQQAIRGSEAVQMFAARARGAGSQIETDEDYAAVAAICVALDGLPLALELAAARTRHFPPAQLLTRLQQGLDELTEGPDDLPARQRTLRATLDWSHALLPERSARFFERLGVFAARFDAEAATAVSGVATTEGDSQQLLLDLADQSLLRLIPGVPPTFRMLHVVREYACQRLAAAGELDQARKRHLGYYAWHIVQLRDTLFAAREVAAYRSVLTLVQQRSPDILAALDYAADAATRDAEVAESGAALGIAAVHCWIRGPGPAGEGMRAVDRLIRALGHSEIDADVHARTVLTIAMFPYFMCDFRRAAQLAAEALERCTALGFDEGVAFALRWLGEAKLWTGDPAGAEEPLRRAVEFAEASGTPNATANMYQSLAQCLRAQGRTAEAEAAAMRAIREAHHSWDPLVLFYCLTTLAEILRDAGQFRRARRILHFTIEGDHRMEALRSLAADLEALATTLCLEGQAGVEVLTLAAAAQRLREGIAMPRPAPIQELLDEALRPVVGATSPAQRAGAEARAWNDPFEDTVAMARHLARHPRVSDESVRYVAFS
jgi:predicted ATPase